ncbi:MAG TPA: TetR/AcrR family transcriptional regulator [Flavisolibacter sp.]|nr:TetR/AcrR family transcriptional regulator [Flavisolibacter sp.]
MKDKFQKKYRSVYLYIRMAKKTTKSEQTRALIIERSAPIFNRKGYAGTSLSDLTEATKLTKGSIYGNFENKDEVALAVFDHNFSKVNSAVAAEMSKCRSAREKLLVYGYIYSSAKDSAFPAGGCPVLNTAIESDDTHPALRKKVIAAIHAWKKNITNVLNEGIARKEFSPGIDTEQIALTMIALIEGSIMIAKATGQDEYQLMIMKSLKALVNDIR